MRDDRYYSSASMSDYIHWVAKDRLKFTEKEWKENHILVSELAKIEFIWRHPMDENRAIDGLELRSDFEYETGEYLDKSSGLMPQCTMFEMLAALAMRCETQLMRDPMVGDRTSKWFFEFLDNLEVLDGSRPVEMACDLFFKGELALFPLKKKGIKQKNEQIWKQLTAYFNENYFNEEDLTLFK